ncbi:MAG: translocation/assembly module TamB domain-containing protein, partial [Planctomycetes bacterium]|nr:translocation/assembly module TamB domain-containing protein [Planctomycetota bacterium]
YQTITASGSLSGDTVDLASIRPLTRLPLLEGSAGFSAELGGPAPFVRSANVTIQHGRVKWNGPVPTIEDIDVALVVGADGARFERAEASLGSGRVTVDGGLLFDGWDDFDNARVDATVTADDALILRRTGLKLRSDAEVTVRGKLSERVDVAGTARLSSGKFVRRVSVLPDYRSQGSNINLGIALPTIPDPIGSRVRYDLAVETQDPFEVVTWVVDAPIQVDVKLRGTGAAPRLEGTLAASDGVVRLPAMNLALTQGVVTFTDARPGFPNLFAVARGTRFGVDVQAQVQGPIDELEIDLTSTPALPREDLTVLLSTGRLPDDLRERGLRSQATLVGTYLAQELLDLYFGSDATDRDETLVDRFRIESGREISRNGVETLTIEFDMREGFFLQAERDMYEDYNMGMLYRFKF